MRDTLGVLYGVALHQLSRPVYPPSPLNGHHCLILANIRPNPGGLDGFRRLGSPLAAAFCLVYTERGDLRHRTTFFRVSWNQPGEPGKPTNAVTLLTRLAIAQYPRFPWYLPHAPAVLDCLYDPFMLRLVEQASSATWEG